MRAKQVFEFHKTNDPLSSLGIGKSTLYKDLLFTSYSEWADFMVSIMPHILGTSEIPKDILPNNTKHYYITPEYWEKIVDFIDDNNIKLMADDPWIDKSLLLRNKFIDLGFKHKKILSSDWRTIPVSNFKTPPYLK